MDDETIALIRSRFHEGPHQEQARLEEEEERRNQARAYLRAGSRDAIEAGCTCPIEDDGLGWGRLDKGCPLHGHLSASREDA